MPVVLGGGLSFIHLVHCVTMARLLYVCALYISTYLQVFNRESPITFRVCFFLLYLLFMAAFLLSFYHFHDWKKGTIIKLCQYIIIQSHTAGPAYYVFSFVSRLSPLHNNLSLRVRRGRGYVNYCACKKESLGTRLRMCNNIILCSVCGSIHSGKETKIPRGYKGIFPTRMQTKVQGDNNCYELNDGNNNH